MEWISVKERMPEINQKIIACWGNENCNVAEMIYVHAKPRGLSVLRFEWQGRISPWRITHWMPLPEPPK